MRALALPVLCCLLIAPCRPDERRADGRDSVARGAWSSNAAALLADSAAADSVALAALPERLRHHLDVSAVLTVSALRDSARAFCVPMSDSSAPEERRRLHATLEDGARAVLFVRADRASGALRRVELVRRLGARAQRGFIWDAGSDSLLSVEWQPDGRRESATLPRGGPAPRALRALGRRLLVLPCRDARPTATVRSPSAGSRARDR